MKRRKLCISLVLENYTSVMESEPIRKSQWYLVRDEGLWSRSWVRESTHVQDARMEAKWVIGQVNKQKITRKQM